jgi:hypothetical protein
MYRRGGPNSGKERRDEIRKESKKTMPGAVSIKAILI